MYLNDIYTIGVNLAGLPGLSDALRLRRRPAGRACSSSAIISTRGGC
jgi:hypothetical protein